MNAKKVIFKKLVVPQLVPATSSVRTHSHFGCTKWQNNQQLVKETMKIWMTHAMSFQNGRINAKTDGLACFSDGWGGVEGVCCLYRPPGLHIRLPVSHLGVCMSTSNPQRRDIRLPGRRFCVKQVCMSWPCSCMDLTLLMWMIIPTLAQIMKRMTETLYRCDKIHFAYLHQVNSSCGRGHFFVSSNSLFHKPLTGI